MNKRTNRLHPVRLWLRRLWIFLVSGFLGSLLVLIGALIFLDGDDYKPVFSWVAGTFFDAELQIDGPLRVHVSSGVLISARQVQLKARDDSYFLSADSLKGDVRLRDVVSGTLWVRDLSVSDFFMKIHETDSGEFDWNSFTFPPVVIERARFSNLVVEYQEIAPGTLHRFALNELDFDDVNDRGPVHLQASGILEGRDFELTGTFPPLEQALDQETPKPVVIAMTGAHMQARLYGTITDPLNGRGMDFNVNLNIPEAHELLEVFWDGIPAVGAVQGGARLQGDYAVPRLADIDIHMHRGEEVDLTVTGSVDNIFTGEGADLHMVGQSSHPQVASWMLFGTVSAISALSIDGHLQEQQGVYRVRDLNAEVKTSDGLEMKASGDGQLYPARHRFSDADEGIDLDLSAPNTDALNLYQVEAIPSLGPVTGRARLIVSRDAIALYKTDLSIGKGSATSVRLQGQLGQVPLHDVKAMSDINLKVDIKTTDLAALARIFDFQIDHDQTAPGHVVTHLTGEGSNINLGQTDISIGSKDGAIIRASGKADNVVVTDTSISANARFDVSASASDLSQFSEFVGVDLPKLGAVAGNANLVVKGTRLTLDQMRINIGAPDQPTIRLDGEVVSELHKGSTVSMGYELAVSDLVAALTGEPPGYLGRLRGEADVSDFDGSWGIEKFRLKSSDTRIYRLDIGGVYKDLKENDLVKVNANLDIDDPVALGKAIGVDLSGYSAYHSEGILTGDDNSISYTATAEVGRTSSKTVLNGSLVNGKPYFKGSFEIPVLYLSDFGFNPEEIVEEPLDIDVDNKGSGDIFSKEPYQLGVLNDFDLDFDFLIDEVESHGELAIDSVNAHLGLKDGHLRLDPFKLVFEGGTTDVTFGLQASGTPSFKLNVLADDVKLGPMMAQVQDDVPINGYSNVHVDINASGDSPHEMASSLNGMMDLGFENAKIPSKYIQFLSVDVLGWAVSSAFKKRKFADLNCVVATFEATNGKVKSTVLIADGPNISLGGSIKLNLRRETMNIVLLPKQKRRLFSSVSPVKIKGPMRNPDIDAVPTKAAIQEIGGMALVPYVYVPLKLIGKLWSVVDDGDDVGQGCAAIKAVSEEAEKKMQQEVQVNE